jgi:hypothetical protein
MMERRKPVRWRCGHRSPIVVTTREGCKRARCLSCGEVGPLQGTSAVETMKALHERAEESKVA